MSNPNTAHWFDDQAAASYDERTKGWAAGREALFSLAKFILAELPASAHILCVGAGTGTEMVALGQAFPEWRFTAVEPAPAMLKLCRHKAEAAGMAARCHFHEGFLDSLPPCETFEAATCLLVSHFFRDAAERIRFFGQIAERLAPGGILINSDLILGQGAPVYDNLLEVWTRLLHASGHPAEGLSRMRETYRRDVVAIPPAEMESMLQAGGFETPTLFYQTLLMHAWFSRRAQNGANGASSG